MNRSVEYLSVFCDFKLIDFLISQAGPSTSNGRSTRNAKRSHDDTDDELPARPKRQRRQLPSQTSDEDEDEEQGSDEEEEEDIEPSVSSRGRIIKNPKRLNY